MRHDRASGLQKYAINGWTSLPPVITMKSWKLKASFVKSWKLEDIFEKVGSLVQNLLEAGSKAGRQ